LRRKPELEEASGRPGEWPFWLFTGTPFGFDLAPALLSLLSHSAFFPFNFWRRDFFADPAD
jgi:hypothetical protein